MYSKATNPKMKSLYYFIFLCVCLTNASPIAQDTSKSYANQHNETYNNIECQRLAQIRPHEEKENIGGLFNNNNNNDQNELKKD